MDDMCARCNQPHGDGCDCQTCQHCGDCLPCSRNRKHHDPDFCDECIDNGVLDDDE